MRSISTPARSHAPGPQGHRHRLPSQTQKSANQGVARETAQIVEKAPPQGCFVLPADALTEIDPAAHGDAVDAGGKAQKKEGSIAHPLSPHGGKDVEKSRPAKLPSDDGEACQNDEDVHPLPAPRRRGDHLISRAFDGFPDACPVTGRVKDDPRLPRAVVGPHGSDAVQPRHRPLHRLFAPDAVHVPDVQVNGRHSPPP